MKKLIQLVIAFIFIANIGHSQTPTILPVATDEYCPLTEITFTVTVPDLNPNVTSSTNLPLVVRNAFNVVVGTDGKTTTFQFIGKFNDVNQKQAFRVTYGQGLTYDFEFKKIKSLFFDNPHNDPPAQCQAFKAVQTSITAGFCQIVNNTISVVPFKWFTKDEGGDFCWGTISTYEYQLPSGWSIGANVSNGSNWIPGGTSVTVTSDATTGGVIKVRPVNSCNSNFVKGSELATINISRPAPTFSVSPNSVEIQCGYAKTETFTVSMAGSTSCPVTYQWYLGPNNGWLDNNGLPAPTGVFTGPASITLTSLTANSNFSSIQVTPILGGVAQTPLPITTTLKPMSLGIVGGSNSICDGTSSPYYLYNAPPNSSSYWGTTTVLPNYGASVVSVNSPYSSSTTLTKINSGVVNLTVSVTNQCYQTSTATRSNIMVGGYTSTELLSGYTLAYPPCYTQGCTPSAVSNQLNTSGPYGTTVYTGTAYTNCTNSLYLYNSGVSSGTWSIVSGSVASWSYSGGNYLQFYPNGGTGDYVRFRLTVNTSCGNVYYDIDFYPTQYNYSGYYMLAPNPVTSDLTVSVDENQLQKMNVTKSSDQDIREVVVIDKMGQMKYKQTAGKGTRQMRINVSNLPTGYYVVRIYNGKDWKSLPFIKQ
ncbi:MAG: T9SS type A sorting domain-containing protein [Flavisolibacter sp.]